MSGENVYNLLNEVVSVLEKPRSGKYEKHLKEMPKPAYSTFYEKNKEYDATHPRYFKQRDAIIGANVGEGVDPKNFLRNGKGVKHIVPPVHHQKQFIKAPLDHKPRKKRNAGSAGGSPLVADALPGGGGGGGGFDNMQPLNVLGNGDGTGDGKTGALDGKVGALGDSAENMGCQGSPGDGVSGGQPGSLRNPGDANLVNGSNLGDVNENGGADIMRNGNIEHGISGVSALGGKKDFVISNIIQMSNMVTKRRKDQPENFTCQKAFGRVPRYLDRVKQEIDEEHMYFKAIEDRQVEQRLQQMSKYVYRLDENERVGLISKLRVKLNEKSSEMSKMPFAKDTFAQVRRRSELESAIKEIEQALAKLEKDAIFIYKDDPQFVHWTKDAAIEEARRFASQPLA